MNANQIINMMMRRVIGMGVNKGIDMATKRRAKDPKDMTPEERMQASRGKMPRRKRVRRRNWGDGWGGFDRRASVIDASSGDGAFTLFCPLQLAIRL